MNCRILDLPFTQPPQKMQWKKPQIIVTALFVSVIYPSFDHPHTKNLRRADPVARFHQMRQCWALQQAPGENDRKGLRWNVREQMLTQFVPEKVSAFLFIVWYCPSCLNWQNFMLMKYQVHFFFLFLLLFVSKIININKVIIFNMKAWVRRK